MNLADTGNAPVGAETTINSKANSAVSFSDLEQMDQAEERAKREAGGKKAEPKPKAEKKPTKREASETFDDEDDKRAGKEAKPGRGEGDEDGREDASEEKDKPENDPDKQKQRPKAHKFKSTSGEEVKVSGDFITTVPVNGKDEEVSLQDLKSHYSGKVSWDRKFSELDREKKDHGAQVQQLNSTVDDLFKRSKENPEDAYDFLAELTGQDSVQLKEKILRQQWDSMQHLAEMSPEDREEWFKDQVRGWRDRKYDRRDEAEKKKTAEAQHSAKLRAARDHHGISEDNYGEAERLARKFLGGETPSPEQVIYADRHLTALEAIHSVVPHLEKHAKFGSIIEDIVQDMLRHPKAFTKQRLEALLKETFPADEKDPALEALAAKAKRSEDLEGTDRPRGKGAKRPEASLWDDIE